MKIFHSATLIPHFCNKTRSKKNPALKLVMFFCFEYTIIHKGL